MSQFLYSYSRSTPILITNHNQDMTAGVANSSDTNTTVRLDGMASCCNLHRDRKCN